MHKSYIYMCRYLVFEVKFMHLFDMRAHPYNYYSDAGESPTLVIVLPIVVLVILAAFIIVICVICIKR